MLFIKLVQTDKEQVFFSSFFFQSYSDCTRSKYNTVKRSTSTKTILISVDFRNEGVKRRDWMELLSLMNNEQHRYNDIMHISSDLNLSTEVGSCMSLIKVCMMTNSLDNITQIQTELWLIDILNGTWNREFWLFRAVA